MSLSKKENTLERQVAEELKEFDKNSRVTRGSGCGNEILDVSHKHFYVSCKDKKRSKNISLDYNKEFLKDVASIPFYSDKELFWVTRNSKNDMFVITDWGTFKRLLEKAYNKGE